MLLGTLDDVSPEAIRILRGLSLARLWSSYMVPTYASWSLGGSGKSTVFAVPFLFKTIVKIYIVPQVSLEKSFLRKKFLKIRSSISPSDSKELAKKAADIFLQNVPMTDSDIISGYYPINHEINPIFTLNQISKQNIKTSLPVIIEKNKPLTFCLWKDKEKLYESKFYSIKEPSSKLPHILPNIIIVPIVCFDSEGHRLGYGGGFYDRTINDLKNQGHNFVTVGMAYSCQKTGLLPKHSYDQQLDFIVTEDMFLAF